MVSDEMSQSDKTIPTRPRSRLDGTVKSAAEIKPTAAPLPSSEAPWVLQQFLNGKVTNLDAELNKRFPNMPVLSVVRFRRIGTDNRYVAATLNTQDRAALVEVELDRLSGIVQFAFTFRSMLSLRFRMSELNPAERARWLELMRYDPQTPPPALAFLWGQARWEKDYLISAVHKQYTNIYAFSPQGYEAAARMTSDVTAKLLHWFEESWIGGDLNEVATPPSDSW
jgi:hypothetical protein